MIGTLQIELKNKFLSSGHAYVEELQVDQKTTRSGSENKIELKKLYAAAF